MTGPLCDDTAHSRFKRRANSLFWDGLALAAGLHFCLFAFWPEMTAGDMARSAHALEAIELPPDIRVPPPPEHITRPARPVASATALDDVTLPPTTFDAHPPSTLTAPPTPGGQRLEDAYRFTPMTLAPRLLNPDEVQRALERRYPRMLRDAGIGGSVVVQFFIDEDGNVLRRQLGATSGYTDLDEAALGVAGVMRFAPAMHRDRRVPVWVEIPVVFRIRSPERA
jgi:periplasmic protein TonB